MSYSIRESYFSPMVSSGELCKSNLHAVVYHACNFQCDFCSIKFRNPSEFIEYSEDEFVFTVSQLLRSGQTFKFTGGEPTLNPNLKRDLTIVKDLGGIVFLDTNGSRPQIIDQLLAQNLIDVLGISLKGFTRDESCRIAHCKNSALCWDNVLESIQLGSDYSTRTIVTHVFDVNTRYEDMLCFSELFKGNSNIYLKINNLLFDIHNKEDLHPLQEHSLEKMVEQLLYDYPEWRGRLILVSNEKAITNHDEIKFY